MLHWVALVLGGVVLVPFVCVVLVYFLSFRLSWFGSGVVVGLARLVCYDLFIVELVSLLFCIASGSLCWFCVFWFGLQYFVCLFVFAWFVLDLFVVFLRLRFGLLCLGLCRSSLC